MELISFFVNKKDIVFLSVEVVKRVYDNLVGFSTRCYHKSRSPVIVGKITIANINIYSGLVFYN